MLINRFIKTDEHIERNAKMWVSEVIQKDISKVWNITFGKVTQVSDMPAQQQFEHRNAIASLCWNSLQL